MLEAAFANEVEQPLHLRDLDDPRSAESVERVVGKPAFAYIAAHLASSVVGGEAGKAHLFRLDEPDAGTKGIFLADRASDDFLEVHLDGAKEVLRQI